jgi:hypothetical protein
MSDLNEELNIAFKLMEVVAIFTLTVLGQALLLVAHNCVHSEISYNI